MNYKPLLSAARLRRFAAAALALSLTLSLAACGASSVTGSYAADTAQSGDAAPEAAAGIKSLAANTDAATGDGTDTGSSGTAADSSDTSRKLVTTASVELDATDFDKATAAIEAQVTALGGYLSNSSRWGDADSHSRSASYEARIPADKLPAFLSGVGAAGTVTSTSQSTTDITTQYVDNDAHLKSLQTQEQRLLELMAQAQQLSDLIALEDKLTDVRYQIESLTSQQKLFDNQVAYATVSVSITEVDKQTITDPTFGQRLLRAVSGSAENAVDFAQGAVIAFIYLLPFLLVIALIVFIVLLLVRAAHRRTARRRAALAAKTAQSAAPAAPAPQPPVAPGDGPAV